MNDTTTPNTYESLQSVSEAYLSECALYQSVVADPRYQDALEKLGKARKANPDDPESVAECLDLCSKGLVSLAGLTAQLNPVICLVESEEKIKRDLTINSTRTQANPSRNGNPNGMEVAKAIASAKTRDERRLIGQLSACRLAIQSLVAGFESLQKSYCKILNVHTAEVTRFRA